MTHLMYHVPKNENDYHEYQCKSCDRCVRIHRTGRMEVLERGENEIEHTVTGIVRKEFSVGAVN